MKNRLGGVLQTTMFVYGSFCKGRIHHGLIANFAIEAQNAKVIGTVYRLEVGYPVLLNKGNHSVSGELVTLENANTLVPVLDQFHGVSQIEPHKSLFFRVEIPVLANGAQQMAYTYVINPQKLTPLATLIENGDWEQDLQTKQPLTEILTAQERTYIIKLSNSSGREIVPIQLDLYRSLLSKKIIIDKGRRLALTKLGQEISWYLK